MNSVLYSECSQYLTKRVIKKICSTDFITTYDFSRLTHEYKLGDLIGEGMFGAVHLLTHKTTGAFFVAKMMKL